MAHLYKVSEWKSPTGKWYCNDLQDLAGISGKWWVPARMLGISLTDYIVALKTSFNATIVEYHKSTDVLIFYWDNYADLHKYALWINEKAKKANFMV